MTGLDFLIRPATAADHGPMLELWERAVRATHHFLHETDIEALRPDVAKALTAEQLDWWVITDQRDLPVGFLCYTPGTVEALFIDPVYHRRGLGVRLLAHAQQLARGPLSLDVNEANQGALQFYESQGFKATGRSPTDSEGRPFPLIHMRRPAVSDHGRA